MDKCYHCGGWLNSRKEANEFAEEISDGVAKVLQEERRIAEEARQEERRIAEEARLKVEAAHLRQEALDREKAEHEKQRAEAKKRNDQRARDLEEMEAYERGRQREKDSHREFEVGAAAIHEKLLVELHSIFEMARSEIEVARNTGKLENTSAIANQARESLKGKFLEYSMHNELKKYVLMSQNTPAVVDAYEAMAAPLRDYVAGSALTYQQTNVSTEPTSQENRRS